jgi:hypothetical protein
VEKVMLRATLLIGLVIPTLAYAQSRASKVPQQERVVPRGRLSVTLRFRPDRIQIDQMSPPISVSSTVTAASSLDCTNLAERASARTRWTSAVARE